MATPAKGPQSKAPQFTLGGIPVRVEPAFLIVIAILGIDPYDVRLELVVSWMVVAGLSILLHELGHAVAFRLYGHRPSIVLYGFGGLTSGSAELTPGRSIVVSLAGPLSALVLAGLPAWWMLANGDVSGDARTILGQIVWVNIGWSLLNLLPVLPLDGGHVFLATLEIVTRGRGRRAAQVVSVAVAAVLGLWAFREGFVFGAMLAAMFAGMNLTQLSKVKVDELNDRLNVAQQDLLGHRPGAAESIVTEVLARRPSGPTLQRAAELAGWCRLWQGDLGGADGAVARYAHAGAPSGCFRAAQALAGGRIAEGVSVMAWSFANEPVTPSRSLGAVAAAGSGQAEAVARELLAFDGDRGIEGARLLQSLLAYTGYHLEAAQVGRLITGAPSGSNG